MTEEAKPVTQDATAYDTKVERKVKLDSLMVVDEFGGDITVGTATAETEYTEAEYRRLRWKIDLWLLPLMWVGRILRARHITTPFDRAGIDNRVVLLWHTAG
jgi:hypothetical protein